MTSKIPLEQRVLFDKSLIRLWTVEQWLANDMGIKQTDFQMIYIIY